MKLIMVLYLNTGIIMSQNLFFSEYAEGSSNNKYLEIYNGGSETINLNNYQLIAEMVVISGNTSILLMKTHL